MRRLLFLATLLISAAAIAYEILLMRVLSIVQWHHFAYMIISLALLGYGASGSFVALNKRWLEPRFELVFSVCGLLFSNSNCWVMNRPPLVRQLKPGGRMIIPVGGRFMTQQLLLLEKTEDDEIKTRQIAAVRFVPLTGEH